MYNPVKLFHIELVHNFKHFEEKEERISFAESLKLWLENILVVYKIYYKNIF